MQPQARRGSTTSSPGAWQRVRVGAQDPPPNQTDELTPAKADDEPRETRDAEERIHRIEGLRDIDDGAEGQDDEQLEEDFRRDCHRGEEVERDGDYGQERIEEREEEEVEEPDDMGKC